MLDARARPFATAVGLSLDDVKAEQGRRSRPEDCRNRKTEGQQAAGAAQQERGQAQEALEQARLPENRRKRLSRYDWRSSRSSRGKKSELAQKKGELAKEKIDVAEKAAEMAQKRLGVTSIQARVRAQGPHGHGKILNDYEGQAERRGGHKTQLGGGGCGVAKQSWSRCAGRQSWRNHRPSRSTPN